MAAVMTSRPRPYVMRPREYVPDKPTAEEPRDHRVPIVAPRRLSLEEVHAITRPGATDPRLRPADRWLERWGVTHGSQDYAPYLESMSLLPRSPPAGVLPLDDHESLLLDAVVGTSPYWAKKFVMLWYRSSATVHDIAKALCIKRVRAVYEGERPMVLAYYLGRFAEIGLNVPTLVDVVA